MSDQSGPTETDETGRVHRLLTSRRRFLEAAGAAGLLAGVGGYALGQQETTYEFGGEVSGWQGQAPDEIAGETNPTIALEAGTEYEVVWENLDGAPHDFVIQDEDGNELAGTDIEDEQGATTSFTFTATEEMARYRCTVHPSSMVGDIEVTAATGTPTDGTATPDDGMATPADVEGYVPAGPSVGVEQVADGPLVNPVTLRSVPGEEDTHLVVDQPGRIYVLTDGGVEDETFLDLSEDVLLLEEAFGGFDRAEGFDERGLLGMDFHPNFEENGRFYVRYSSRESVGGDGLAGPPGREYPDDWDHVEVLSEFETRGDQAFAPADRDSERVLLEVPSPQFNHNGGEVVFGPDDYLYTSIGDGGDGGDTGVGHEDDWYDEIPGGNAQNVEANLLGTVVRIDVDGESTDRPYDIPDDNPLLDTSGYDEIFAYGLRNPWRMSFDGDRLIAADVGQSLFEEVDVVENGGNYGWNVREGFHCFDPEAPTEPPADCPTSEPDEAPYDGSEFVDPVLEYPHQYENQPVGISVTGGYVAGGDQVEELSGQYVFGDWSASFVEPQGRIFVASPDAAAEEGTPADGGTPGEDETPDGEATQTEAPTETPTQTPTETAAEAATETAAEGETPTGDETPEDKGEQPEDEPEQEVDLTPPDEQPWQWEEVLIEGGENQQINRFVQAFGRDADGRLYVLASRTGRLRGENGEVFRLVPAGEGESVEAPDVPAEDGAGGDGNETGGNETGGGENSTI